MSDSESATAAPAHPAHGGKSIESVQQQQNQVQGERLPYKSWRKKYRKMRVKFEVVLEENKKMFREEQKLEGLAKRLREELDELLDICLDLNQNPAIPTSLRYDVRLPHQKAAHNNVRPNITPEGANLMMIDYTKAVQNGSMPPLDLHVIRENIQERLAAQEVIQLAELEKSVPQPIPTGEEDLPEEMRGQEPPGYMTTEQEIEYLTRLDAKMAGDIRIALGKAVEPPSPHQAELTPRELERQMELMNPQSQHSWLKSHSKLSHVLDGDDNESLASHETKAPPRKRANKNLAKQVGDRAVGRAREGHSPGAASGFEEDELAAPVDETPAGKKRARDADGTYRVKGGKGGNAKGKRKRATDDGDATSKKAKTTEATTD